MKRASLEPHYCNIVDVQVLRSQSGFALKKGCILSLWQSHKVEGRKKSFKIAGSPYTEFFNYHLQKLDESGALDRMHRRYSHKPVSGTPKRKI